MGMGVVSAPSTFGSTNRTGSYANHKSQERVCIAGACFAAETAEDDGCAKERCPIVTSRHLMIENDFAWQAKIAC